MRRSASGERGASIVELALILPLLATIVLGVLDLSRAYRLQIRLEGAARGGAEHALIYPNEFDCASTDDDILGEAAAAEPALTSYPGYTVSVFGEDAAGNLVVPVTGCTGTVVDPGEALRVDVQATYGILTPLIAAIVGNTVTVEGSAEIETYG